MILESWAFWAVAGYLMGTVPFGLLLARGMGLGDLRKVGSGNIGATNVLRTGNKRAAALTLLLDGGKGALAVLLARALAGDAGDAGDAPLAAMQAAALGSFLGHCFPVWLRFRGGKGVATFLGIMLALAWPVGLAACATWAAVASAMRISSLAALLAAGFTPVWAVVLGRGEVAALGMLLAALIYWRHWGNIQRLRAGTEPRIGAGKTAAKDA